MLNIKPPDYKFCPFCGKTLDKKIEEGKERKYCKDDKWTYYPHTSQASNSIIIEKGKVLLVQRNREPFKGKWMFPAGFLNFGEHPEECAIREVEEETGMKVESAVFFDILQTEDDPRAPGNLTFYYSITLKDGQIPKNGDTDENSDIKWFDLNDLPPIAWKDHLDILNRLKRE